METISSKRNNCVLVMLKELTGKSDSEILAAVRRHNYKDNRGMFQEDYLRAARELGMKFGAVHWSFNVLSEMRNDNSKAGRDPWFRIPPKLTIRHLLKIIKKGVYMVRVHGHVLVVRDGKLVDHNISRARLGRAVLDFIEVYNPFVEEKKGYVVIAKSVGRRYGTRSWEIEQEMRTYLRSHRNVTPEQLLQNCKNYTRPWLNWDLERGVLIIV